jgi:hypothetical protein
MNLELQDYYNELYRIFSQPKVLLSTTQLALLGDCMRSLIAGENVTAKLEKLFDAVQNVPQIAETLENFMHEYNKYAEENTDIVDDDEEDINDDYKNNQPFTGYKFTGSF